MAGPAGNEAEWDYVAMWHVKPGLEALLTAAEKERLLSDYRAGRHDPEVIRALKMNVCRRDELNEKRTDWETLFLSVVGARLPSDRRGSLTTTGAGGDCGFTQPTAAADGGSLPLPPAGNAELPWWAILILTLAPFVVILAVSAGVVLFSGRGRER